MFKHAQFLQSIQTWVSSYIPTRQLSPNDLYYAMQWSESGVRACDFTDHFDRYIGRFPDFMKDGFRLSRLDFEAQRVIQAKRKTMAQTDQQLVEVYDPFPALLELIATIGRETPNDFVRQALRVTWRSIKLAHEDGKNRFPHWADSAIDFYQLKALAITSLQSAVDALCNTCYETLALEEQNEITKLTPLENIHLLQLGAEASQRYIQNLRLEKIAKEFELSPILHYFD